MMNFIKEEKGQGMAEYGLILALVAIAAIAALTTMGTKLGPMFDAVSAKLNAPA